jgi:hypothetical protein
MHHTMRKTVSAFALLAIFPVLSFAAASVPAGTPIDVTINQSVSSKTATVGQTLSGVVSRNVIADGKVVIPKGSSARLVVSSVQASGRLSTPAKLWLRLTRVTVRGKSYAVSSSLAGKTMGGKGGRDTAFIGGGGAAGALIGGLAGGGKGALIGGLAGAGAGTAGAAATGKKEVEFPAETRLAFTTRAALALN